MKVGDKFVIEIAETFGQNSYKIKGLNSVYSKDTMDKLEPFDETTAFTNGLAAMWEIAKRLGSLVEDGGMPTDDIEELFGCEFPDVYVKYSAQEVIKKLAEYKDEIRVGDEVMAYCGDAIVISKFWKGEEEWCTYWYPRSERFDRFKTRKLRKTGRHFPQVAELLEAIKGERTQL